MEPFDPDDDRLDRELRDLPGPRAPRTLLPRVLAATGTGSAPGATGWRVWSRGRRAAVVAALVLLLAAALPVIASPPAEVTRAADTAGEVATLARVLWQVMLQPVATYLFVLGITLALGCAVAWAAFEAALGGASHR